MTERQIQKPGSAMQLQTKIGVLLRSEVEGRKVLLGGEAGSGAVRVATDYVLALDEMIQAAQLHNVESL